MWKELILCLGIKRGKDFPNVLCRLCNKIHFANKRNTHTHSRACTRAHTHKHTLTPFILSLFPSLFPSLFLKSVDFEIQRGRYLFLAIENRSQVQFLN